MCQPMKMHKETCLHCGWIQRPRWDETLGDWVCDHCGGDVISDEELARLERFLNAGLTPDNDN